MQWGLLTWSLSSKVVSLLGPCLAQDLEYLEREALKKEWGTERKWD